MLKGLYRAEFETPRGKAVGVLVARDGNLHGDSSAFAFVGSYRQVGHSIIGRITTMRHTDDSKRSSMFGINDVRIDFSGAEKDGFASIEGTAAEVPALAFKAVLTRISD